MKKSDEVSKPDSCLNKAHDCEFLFVLLSRDPAAPIAIWAWINERVRLGLNSQNDPKIVEAYTCATRMRIQYERQEALKGGTHEADSRPGSGD